MLWERAWLMLMGGAHGGRRELAIIVLIVIVQIVIVIIIVIVVVVVVVVVVRVRVMAIILLIVRQIFIVLSREKPFFAARAADWKPFGGTTQVPHITILCVYIHTYIHT